MLAGAGSNDTQGGDRAVEGHGRARRRTGVLSVGPYYNKPTPEGFFRHFAAIADASPVPVVVYNVPGRTGSNIDATTQLRLAAHPNIAAVKEASGNLAQMMEILRDRPRGLRGALGRRRVHPGHDGPGRRKASSRWPPTRSRDRCTISGRGLRARRLRGGAAHPQPAARPHEPELRGVEPDAGQGLAGPAGAVRGELPPAPVPAHGTRRARPCARPWRELGLCLVSDCDGPRRAPARGLPLAARGGARATRRAPRSTTLREALESGRGRARPSRARRAGRVNGWVKKGILLGFRLGRIVARCPARVPSLSWTRTPFPRAGFAWTTACASCPAGRPCAPAPTSAPGSWSCLRPTSTSGAYVGEGSMIDSHALVGSCAQVGRRVHLSAAASSAACWSRWARCP